MLTQEQEAELAYLTKLQLREEEERAAEKAKVSLLNFIAYTKDDFEVNWHHKLLCTYLDAFVEGKIKRLMVFMPPRHGKSEVISRRLPPYILGRDPNKKVILTSYAAALATTMNMDAQSVMDSEKYQTVFPNSPLLRKGMSFEGRTPKRTQDYVEIADTEKHGSLKTVGVGGPLTGFGFNLGIIDDPFKNREEADSETTREAVWKWYTSTFLTRQNDDEAGICLLMTRWHEEDLAGKLLELAKKDPNADQWVVLTLPAIAGDTPANKNDRRKPGEALWPNRYPVSYLMKQKAADTRDWAALFQQNPFTEEGAILKKNYWRFYRPHELPRYLDEKILSVDCTFKDLDTSDYVVIQVWGREGANKYLIDQYKEKMDFNETCDAILSMVQKHPDARAKLVEDKANGTAVMASMRRRISGFIEIEPHASKIERAFAISPQLRSGNVLLPVPDTCTSFNVNEFIDECAKFPRGKHDDQVDACTQALAHLEANEGIEIAALAQW